MSLSANYFYSNITQLRNECQNSKILIDSLEDYTDRIYNADLQQKYSEPLPWIGMYIVLASLVCILAMGADLIHGFSSRKLWFPCNYFSLNAAIITVIGVAIKLPLDLNNSMPSDVDQAAKLGSVAFMCTVMVNALPSLASMENRQLVSNITGLGVVVITLVVNLCIQMSTGVVSQPEFQAILDPEELHFYIGYIDRYKVFASIYVAMLLLLLMILACSALAILESKHILESKYLAAHEIAVKDHKREEEGRLTVEELKQDMKKYWIMAGTGSPQFMIVCFATTSASGAICALSTVIHTLVLLNTLATNFLPSSDYDWSIPVILITQSVGVILGTIAPLCRCFVSLSLEVSIRDHIKVFKVESYWTRKLCDWKESSISLPFCSDKGMVVMEISKGLIISFCVGLQTTVVVACKMIALTPVFVSASGNVFLKKFKHQQENVELSEYVMKFQDNMVPAGRTVGRLLKSMDRTIQKAEKQPPKNLKKLIEESSSRSFEGVVNFDSHDVEPLHSEEYPNSWSLPLVTLMVVTSSLPNIPKEKLKSVSKSVREGLAYVTTTEEILNASNEYVNIQVKAAKELWRDVVVYHKWLENKVKDLAPEVKTTRQILEWYRDTSKNIVTGVKGTDIEGSNKISTDVEGSNESKISTNLKGSNESTISSICANSMYRITQTILLFYQDNNHDITPEGLFDRLSFMIADILAACLTNLPQVIATKCRANVQIEKREASVHAAAQLLGETTEIINFLQQCKLPCMISDELPYIDKWRTCTLSA